MIASVVGQPGCQQCSLHLRHKNHCWITGPHSCGGCREVAVHQRMLSMLANTSGASLPQLASDAAAAETAAQAAQSQAAAASRFAHASTSGPPPPRRGCCPTSAA